jgi:hypothetical protein
MTFLTHYQLPIRYETETKILSSFKKSCATYISNHIHKWRRRGCLIKIDLPDQLLAEWFTKSFISKIIHDISMGGVVTEEQVISRAQYLDLIYSQKGTLHDLILDDPLPFTITILTTPSTSHVVDGVIGTFHAKNKSMHAPHTNPKSNSSNFQHALTPTPSTGKTSEVNSVQSTPASKNKSKKGKGKNKEDKNNNPQSKKPQNTTC